MAAALQGCNSDIFVDRVQEPTETNIILAPMGEEHTIKIATKGLTGVDFDDNSVHHDYTYTVYYDKDGNDISNFGSISDLSKISYLSPRFCVDFIIKGDEVTIKALDNTYSSNLSISAALFYEHEMKNIEITVTPGNPIEIKDFGYDIVRPVSEIRTETGMPAKFHNNTDRTQRVVFYPYKDARSRMETLAEDYDSWQDGTSGDVIVPYYSNGEWVESEDFKQNVLIGSTVYYDSPNTPVDEETYIDVEPQSSVSWTMSITYAMLDVAYLADFVQPGSGFSWLASGKCRVFNPIGYELNVTKL